VPGKNKTTFSLLSGCWDERLFNISVKIKINIKINGPDRRGGVTVVFWMSVFRVLVFRVPVNDGGGGEAFGGEV
jgi:hypothetical protein